jgi:mannose-6-phosphate isomerase-like protein (cupin superfamily)
MPSHPAFRLEGRSQHFQSFWEVELTPGENTVPHQHYESEELIYLVHGAGRVRVDGIERPLHHGEVVLVPPRTDHVIANTTDAVLRAITVESRFDLGLQPPERLEDLHASGEELRAQEEARNSLGSIEQIMRGLPTEVDEALAIQAIVELFDIGGRLAEQIEHALGLDNSNGVEALGKVERRIMQAVVEITGRYRGQGWFRG